jgi:ribonucleoside-diphosphate reductase beta chain
LETFANRSFWPGFFSRVAARKQWDAAAIDFAPDASAWPQLPDDRRRRLTTILAGFRVGEDAVAGNLTPFVAAANRETLASQESLMAWTFTLQRRDEERHARFFDRMAAEVLRLPGDSPDERRAAARDHATPEILELFEERLPTLAAELAAGESGLPFIGQKERLNRWIPAAVPIIGAARFTNGTRNSRLTTVPIRPCSPRVDLSQARRELRSP